jgi:hypothetical protein
LITDEYRKIRILLERGQEEARHDGGQALKSIEDLEKGPPPSRAAGLYQGGKSHVYSHNIQ